MKLIYQDSNFVFVDKPSNVLTVPPRSPDDRRVLGLELQKFLNQQIFPVHRLDYEVSGLVMYALNAEAHRRSQKWFELRQVTKKYEAMTRAQGFAHWPAQIENPRKVIAIELNKEWIWKSKILRGKKRSYQSPHGEDTITKALIFKDDGEHVYWELEPITGKPHQLRFELSYRGFPILGDNLYGGPTTQGLQGIALRSYELNFKNVQTAERGSLPETIALSRSFR